MEEAQFKKGGPKKGGAKKKGKGKANKDELWLRLIDILIIINIIMELVVVNGANAISRGVLSRLAGK